jgi:predicted amidohydrolase YtcJ
LAELLESILLSLHDREIQVESIICDGANYQLKALDFCDDPTPVLVTHQCGRSFFVNSLAISGIGESQFSNLEGVGRDRARQMTGVLETARTPRCCSTSRS